MVQTSASLLERLQLPRERDWNRFVLLYTPLFYVWANRLGFTGADADDLVQEVFTALVSDLPRFQYNPNLRFRGWLWGLIRHKARDHHRDLIPVATAVLETIPDRVNSDSGSVIEEQEYHRFLASRAIELLQTDFEPETWKAFWETTVQSRSAAEVAAEIGVTENAVYLAKSRVLRRLRAELAGLLD